MARLKRIEMDEHGKGYSHGVDGILVTNGIEDHNLRYTGSSKTIAVGLSNGRIAEFFIRHNVMEDAVKDLCQD